MGDESFDLILDGLLEHKRGLSREIVVPTTMTDEDARAMFARMTRAGGGPEEATAELDAMGWQRFELWIAEQFRAAGYQSYTTPGSGDGGGDVILRAPPGGRPIICQCKHRSRGETGMADGTAVYDVLRARGAYSRIYPWLDHPVLFAVTNGYFELSAVQAGEQHGVVTVDRAQIVELTGSLRNTCGPESSRHVL